MHRNTLLITLLALLLAGCASAAMVPSEPASPTATATVAPTQIPLPSATETRPTATATVEPSATASPTLEPSVTLVASDDPSLVIYLLRENTGGPVGCGDTLVPVRLNVQPSGDPLADVRTVMEFFFTTKGKYPYGLFDPLYASSIAVTAVYWGETEIHVETTGTMTRPEKGCGWDQIRAVANETARAAAGGNQVEISLNDRPFNDWASADHP
ncbi:MAG: hypothetical protein EPO32_04925 [Anaerolineae bacterium]|nr:MAG: hypothetical protein EPO32_04925 [Anaerolineae bacterium]